MPEDPLDKTSALNQKQHSIHEDEEDTFSEEDDLKDFRNDESGFPDLDKDSNGSSIIHEEKDNGLQTNDFS